MLHFRSCSYDPATALLTVRLVSPSHDSWAWYEYRDVPDGVADRLARAGLDAGDVLEEEIAPRFDVRRVGQTTWRRAPQPVPGRSPLGLTR